MTQPSLRDLSVIKTLSSTSWWAIFFESLAGLATVRSRLRRNRIVFPLSEAEGEFATPPRAMGRLPSAHYSLRRAVMGSTRVARRAGT